MSGTVLWGPGASLLGRYEKDPAEEQGNTRDCFLCCLKEVYRDTARNVQWNSVRIRFLMCVSYFSHCCGKLVDEKQLERRKGFYFGMECEDVITRRGRSLRRLAALHLQLWTRELLFSGWVSFYSVWQWGHPRLGYISPPQLTQKLKL